MKYKSPNQYYSSIIHKKRNKEKKKEEFVCVNNNFGGIVASFFCLLSAWHLTSLHFDTQYPYQHPHEMMNYKIYCEKKSYLYMHVVCCVSVHCVCVTVQILIYSEAAIFSCICYNIASFSYVCICCIYLYKFYVTT